MIYEDKYGNLLLAEEIEELFSWEIEEREIRATGINI